MLPTSVSIYLALSPVDLRKGFDLLSGLVSEQLGGDARAGDLYIFMNKPRTRLKALFYDRTGYCVLYKRLDRGTFPLPVVMLALLSTVLSVPTYCDVKVSTVGATK